MYLHIFQSQVKYQPTFALYYYTTRILSSILILLEIYYRQAKIFELVTSLCTTTLITITNSLVSKSYVKGLYQISKGTTLKNQALRIFKKNSDVIVLELATLTRQLYVSQWLSHSRTNRLTCRWSNGMVKITRSDMNYQDTRNSNEEN